MTTEFTQGQVLQRGDIDIFFQDNNDQPENVYSITYGLYYVDPGPPSVEIPIGSTTRVPVNPVIGEYYAPLMVPPSATLGTYRVRWTFVQYSGGASAQVVMEFDVVEKQANVVTYEGDRQALINRLRILLRDQNPDKFYHFRPPEHEGRIGKFNRVFGQIWEDNELNEYLETALEWWNMQAPETESLSVLETLITVKPVWKTPVVWRAIVHAVFALTLNWIADEFDYNIGGVSLSIQKSSSYEGLKSNAESECDKMVEMKARTYKITRGLQQPRYGRGIRSSFGPYTSRSAMSPRSFW
jgi:hypothetical protein